MQQILNIGCTGKYLCNDPRQTFPEAHIFTLDVDPESKPDILHDFTQPLPEEWHGKFDVLYMSHVLEHINRVHLRNVMRNWNAALKMGGELWVFVPCLEWAAREILDGKENLVIQGSIYGGQTDEWDLHRAGYTLNALVDLVKRAGFDIRKKGVSTYWSIVNGRKYVCYQNVAIGIKHGNSPAGD